jgi:sulfur carrier protein
LKITVNGKLVEISENTSLGEFIEARKLKQQSVIAELNEKVIERGMWENMVLTEGDCLELVALVGGG